ncbi:MAG: HAD family hydrolase [Candidatus Woesebacteria bacterium]
MKIQIKQSPIRLIIIDVDQTLAIPKDEMFYVSFSLAVDRATARYFGVTKVEGEHLANEYRSLYGNGESVFFIGPTKVHRSSYGIKEKKPSILYEEMCAINPTGCFHRRKKVRQLIQSLRSNGVIVVALTDAPEKLSHKILKEIGMQVNDFDAYIAFEKDGIAPKYQRDGAVFNYIAHRFHIPNANVICIGDSSEADVLPALKMGMQGCIISPNKNAEGRCLCYSSAEKILQDLFLSQKQSEKTMTYPYSFSRTLKKK